MHSKTRIFTVLGLTSLLGALFVAPGCGSPAGATVEEVCEQSCSCGQSCGSSGLSDCVKSGGELQDRAEKAGCGALFNEYLQCLSDNLDCKGGGAQLPTECNSVAEEITQCVGSDDSGE